MDRSRGTRKLSLYLDEATYRILEELQRRYPGLSKNDIIRLALKHLLEAETAKH